MNPQQPYQTNNGTPYDFILNPSQPPKKPLIGKHTSLVKLLALIIGGAVLLMVVLGIGVSMLSGNKTNTADLLALAQTQNEIVRVAALGAAGATQQNLRNLATTTQLGIQTHENDLTAFVAKKGQKVDAKELKLKQNGKTDQQLKAAKETSTFDVVFAQIIQRELLGYATATKELIAKAGTTDEKSKLSAYYEQTQLLISQVPQTTVAD